MSATVVVLAEYRAAKLRYAVTLDPLTAWRQWWDWMAGAKR